MDVSRRLLHTALIAAAATAAPISAEAQDKVAITFAAGAISSTDPAPADHFVEPTYIVSFQGVTKRFFVVEGEVSHWSHTLRVERRPHDISGPQGVIGRVSGTTTVDAHSVWTAGANLLVRSTGAVRVFGGAGASLSMDHTDYSQQSVGCSGGLDPRTCEPFRNTRMRGPIPVFRALAGVDVPISRHLGIFGSVRAETSTWEDRRNWMSGIAGVRFAFS